MAQPQRFTVDIAWKALAADLGLDSDALLRQADLPRDLFSRAAPTLSVAEYLRLWGAIEAVLGRDETPLRIGQAISPDIFSPPLFAAFCSPNLTIAMSRLRTYKPLIGPLRMELQSDDSGLEVSCDFIGNTPVPFVLGVLELVFAVHIARLATRTHIRPARVELRRMPADPGPYEAFFGTRLTASDRNSVRFRPEDAARPFLSVNDSMYQVFEPELRRRLADLSDQADFRARVRAALVEALPAGRTTARDLAKELAVSTRTLQRRLSDEGTSFQAELTSLRAELANTYLTRTRTSSAEIAFLLGYEDPTSFARAFQTWTGETPQQRRRSQSLH